MAEHNLPMLTPRPSFREVERERPSAQCLRMCQVFLATCILLSQTSQPATEVCRDMWVWSIASPPRGRVYPPRAQCGIIVCPKIMKFLGSAALGNDLLV